MTCLEDRRTLLHTIEEARAGGARLVSACALAGIDPRTVQRWQTGDGLARGDRRPDADRPTPSHALTAAERARIIEVANTSRNRAGDITNINWHGPLVNHFHIDLAF